MRFSARFSTCCISQLKFMLYLTSVVRAVSSRYISCYIFPLQYILFLPMTVHALSPHYITSYLPISVNSVSSRYVTNCIFPWKYSLRCMLYMYCILIFFTPCRILPLITSEFIVSNLHYMLYRFLLSTTCSLFLLFTTWFYLFTTYCIPYLLHVCLPIIHFMPCLPTTVSYYFSPHAVIHNTLYLPSLHYMLHLPGVYCLLYLLMIHYLRYHYVITKYVTY